MHQVRVGVRIGMGGVRLRDPEISQKQTIGLLGPIQAQVQAARHSSALALFGVDSQILINAMPLRDKSRHGCPGFRVEGPAPSRLFSFCNPPKLTEVGRCKPPLRRKVLDKRNHTVKLGKRIILASMKTAGRSCSPTTLRKRKCD